MSDDDDFAAALDWKGKPVRCRECDHQSINAMGLPCHPCTNRAVFDFFVQARLPVARLCVQCNKTALPIVRKATCPEDLDQADIRTILPNPASGTVLAALRSNTPVAEQCDDRPDR